MKNIKTKIDSYIDDENGKKDKYYRPKSKVSKPTITPAKIKK